MLTDNKEQKKLIGRRFAAVRTLRGLRQADLAELIGVNMYTVSKWERGVQLPDADLIAELCTALDCSADYLLGLSETVRHA